jgi:hypothetical protein
MLMKTRYTLAALLFAASWTAGPSATYAVPLLAVDFGQAEEDALQSGFQEMTGGVSQTTANATFGAYTVDLAGQGFFNVTSGNATAIEASVRPLYRDYFYHNSDVPGVGVTLGIGGVTPNAVYNLTLWSYDPDQTFSATPTTWGPTGATSGTSGSVTDFALPRPDSLDDYSTTIQVSSPTGVLEVFGTTTSGFGGTRLNAFRLNDGSADVLSIDVGQPVTAPSAPQAGFVSMHGLQSQASISKNIGAYVVSIAGQGFENTSEGNANEIDPSVRNLYRDTYYNNDDRPGFGVTLTIEGVTPNTDYDLKLWSYDAAQFFSSTPTVWSPQGATTGTEGTIVNFASPRPDSLDDYSTTIRVRSSTSTLTIFGTTTSGFGGTRLNGFELTAVPEPAAAVVAGTAVVLACCVCRPIRRK